MYDNHELYLMEHEERVRKAQERNRFHQWMPKNPNWLVLALNQFRLFLF